jgi:hypothetical protein
LWAGIINGKEERQCFGSDIALRQKTEAFVARPPSARMHAGEAKGKESWWKDKGASLP